MNSDTIDLEAEKLVTDDDVIEDGHGIQNLDEEITSSKEKKGVKKGGKKVGVNLKRKRILTSPVWAHFEILPLGADNKQRCRCKKCGCEYLSDSRNGTGNMKRHLDVCKKRDTREIGQLLVSSVSSDICNGSKFDPMKFRELLAAAVIMHDLPFSFVEYRGIRAAFAYLNNNVTFITRNTCKADVKKIFKKEKERVKFLLNTCPGRISLTSDLWTSITTDGYMCLTAHFVDADWNLHKRVISFSYMPPPHNGISLCDKIYNLLCEWGIEKKLFGLTLDNASSNDVSVELLIGQLNARDALLCKGEFFHLRCCTHVLNLIVQDGLKEIDQSVHKIRESIKYIRGSQIRKIKFLESVKKMSLDPKKGLRQDVPTRWNSTFLMLESALYYRSAFVHFGLTDSNYIHCPNAVEWNKAGKVCRFLSVFYDCTCVFSGTKYPTANLFFPACFLVYNTLIRERESDDDYIREVATRMYTKYHKYWSEFVVILAIAVVLDPRYKLKFVDFSYRQVYNGPNSTEFKKVQTKLYALFDEYVLASKSDDASVVNTSSKYGGISSSGGKNSDLFGRRGTTELFKDFDEFDNEEMSSNAQKSQLELYLAEPRLDRNSHLDVLKFWRANELRYPELAAMAKDILSMPISTVASESTFSIGALVLDHYRSSLSPGVVEALICSRDWLYGEQGIAIQKLEEITENIMDLDISKDTVDDEVVEVGEVVGDVSSSVAI